MSDSQEVIDLKAKQARARADRSDWGNAMAKTYAARIRSQRLKEARTKGAHTPDEWTAIVQKFDSRCVICGCEPVGGPCKDHILPIYKGGSDAADNLQPVCRECNTGKGSNAFNWAKYREVHGFREDEC